MFNINWCHTCYECGCPLDLFCTIKDDDIDLFFRDFTTWVYLKPFTLVYNKWYYKCYGMKIHRVCISCYFFPKRVDLFKREIGEKCKQYIQLSKTFEEVYQYFESFQEFRQRKDIEICIVETEKRKILRGLQVYWAPTSYLNITI